MATTDGRYLSWVSHKGMFVCANPGLKWGPTGWKNLAWIKIDWALNQCSVSPGLLEILAHTSHSSSPTARKEASSLIMRKKITVSCWRRVDLTRAAGGDSGANRPRQRRRWRIWWRHKEEWASRDTTIFTYDAARLSFDAAAGASGDDVSRRGLPTARGGEGDASPTARFSPVQRLFFRPLLPLARVLFLRYRCLDLAAWGFLMQEPRICWLLVLESGGT
jgi:hypothetical protein